VKRWTLRDNAPKGPLTQARLKELVHYDPETGVFTNLVSRGRAWRGKVVGTKTPKGHLGCEIDGKSYHMNRLAWLYMTGEWPPHPYQVDHIDLNKANDAWINLRLATNKQNQENRGPTKTVSGVAGVTRRGKKWLARIRHNDNLIVLGYYKDVADAIHVRQAAERLLFTHSQLCRSQ
jgi:hypothetical protein